ncbi:hypothetical protein BDV96DRAFT_469467, partial [Lophiotrema nucula]
MPPGILWVSSRIQNPSILSPEKFCTWYENTHIQEVTALSGVPSAARYQALSPSPVPTPTWSSEAPWLTIYEMPVLDFRESKEFKSLDGQSKPREELLEGIFKQARFDTRFYEQVQVYEPFGKIDGPAKFLISAALQPKAGEEEDFEAWYQDEHLKMLAECQGYLRTR